MGRVVKNREITWVCGECGYEVDYLESAEPPSVCPNSDYIHGQKPIRDVPEEVRIPVK